MRMIVVQLIKELILCVGQLTDRILLMPDLVLLAKPFSYTNKQNRYEHTLKMFNITFIKVHLFLLNRSFSAKTEDIITVICIFFNSFIFS